MKYVSKVYVSPDSLEMTEGSWYYKASARVEPSDATNPKIRWFSQNTGIASVNPTSGYIYAKAEGATYICAAAKDGSGAYDCINVTVRKRVPVESVSFDFSRFTIKKGEQKTISATVSPANATDKKLTWSSSDTGVATVAGGVVTAVAHGRAVITATANDGSGKSASCTITVTEKIPVSSIEMIPTPPLTRYDESETSHYLLLPVREGVTFSAGILPANATDRTVVWSTDNPDVVTVNQKSGYVFGKATGKATICVRAADGSEVSNSVKIFVITPAESVTLSHSYRTLTPNETVRLSATVSPQNASIKNVQWSSNNPSVATVSNTGLVTAKKVGTAIITAESADGCASGRCNVTITATTTAKYYNIVNKNGKVVNVAGVYLMELKDNADVTLYTPSDSNEQIWRIDTFSNSNDCYIKSYVDETYGFNYNRRQTANNKCDLLKIVGNETDSKLYFDFQEDGYCKIKLANYNRYLTAIEDKNGASIKWSESQSSNLQLWKFTPVNLEKREAEKIEYHLIPFVDIDIGFDNKRAVQVAMKTPNSKDNLINQTFRLQNDEPLELSRFSYINKQKWKIKGEGTTCRIYTSHGDDYCLRYKNDPKVYVSNNDTYEADVTIVDYNTSRNLVRIKLSCNNYYLTLSDSGIEWRPGANNPNNQIWQLVRSPLNIHNGADTASPLYDGSATDKDRTIRAFKLGGEEFVIRYYADVGEIKFKNKILTPAEATALHNRGIHIVSIYQDSADDISYFTAENGTKDARMALAMAENCNQPENSAIYFAVDRYIGSDDVNKIINYFSAVKFVFNRAEKKYKLGVYGSGLVCSRMKDIYAYADYSWLCGSTDYPGYSSYDSPEYYEIKQAEIIEYNGTPFDDCVAVGDDYGQW